MASPQKENGFTSIANELLEKLCQFSLPGRELRVLLFVIRKTYGYRQKSDWISLSQFAEGTKIDISNICKILKKLVAKNLLIKAKNSYSLQKDWEQWGTVVDDYCRRRLSGTVVDDFLPTVAHDRYKRKIYKRKITKETVSKDTEGRAFDIYKKILKKEVMSRSDERDRSFPRKRTWGDEKIDWTLDYLEHLLGRNLSGQERWNRIYARHLTNKWGMKETKRLLEWLADPSGWWFDKVSQMATVYKKSEALFEQMDKKATGPSKKKTIEELTIRAD